MFPDFLEVSPRAQSFIERVLTKYPKNRMTVEEMSAHQFLSGSSVYEYHNEMMGRYGEVTP